MSCWGGGGGILTPEKDSFNLNGQAEVSEARVRDGVPDESVPCPKVSLSCINCPGPGELNLVTVSVTRPQEILGPR